MFDAVMFGLELWCYLLLQTSSDCYLMLLVKETTLGLFIISLILPSHIAYE